MVEAGGGGRGQWEGVKRYKAPVVSQSPDVIVTIPNSTVYLKNIVYLKAAKSVVKVLITRGNKGVTV